MDVARRYAAPGRGTVRPGGGPEWWYYPSLTIDAVCWAPQSIARSRLAIAPSASERSMTVVEAGVSLQPMAAAAATLSGWATRVVAASTPSRIPVLPDGITAPQFDGASYRAGAPYGSAITAAWSYTSGGGATVALVDDGFDPATTSRYGNFSAILSRSFSPGGGAIGEPAGGFHGTTTSGLIGAAGRYGMPEGVAPAATLVGVKVSFSTGTLASFVQAETYAASVAGVVNNSWAFTGYAGGEPGNAAFTGWYGAMQQAVQSGRSGLGSVVVFAAGNDRSNANSLAVQPITADYRVIAVAASDPNGTVASYSTPGAALLVAAIGDGVAVPATGGSGYRLESGTSYAAPTVSGIVAMLLSVNPALGWRDVQEILADAAYAPAPSASGFSVNGSHQWNGGGRHFSNDLGFGVVDANVAVNLARAWTLQSTSANQVTATAVRSVPLSVPANGFSSSTIAITANIRVQHVQVTISDSNMPISASRVVLIAPGGTQSVLLDRVGLVRGRDLTGGLDLSGNVLTSNAFWGESATGSWTLGVQDINGRITGVINSWRLTVIGDNAATVASPLVYTPEFAALASGVASRTTVTPQGATTIDLIALPGVVAINLNGGSGTIDGVGVRVGQGLRIANADGSIGTVTLTGLSTGGSQLTGGDAMSTLNGAGRDTFYGGLGVTAINTGSGGSIVRLTMIDASRASIVSGGGDTIWAGLATATVTDVGSKGDVVYAQAANLTFINGDGASTVLAGTGRVSIAAGVGGGTYYAGHAGGSHLMAGSGLVTFYGEADGDILTAAGTANDVLIAGAGAETLAGGAATGAITLVGGSGNDLMTAGAGRTTFVLGTGNDTIVVGGIRDVIQIRAGAAGGASTISGFRLGIDDLQLIGFAGHASGTAISSQGTDGHGGTLLRFLDNTRIDLLGIGHVTQTAFV
jgi:subtilisin family serine protease